MTRDPARRLALRAKRAIHALDRRRGTESRTGGVGPIRLSGLEWQRLLRIANQIEDEVEGAR